MRVCPRCQHENADDTDFCAQCGEYLRWDPTVATSAVPPRPAFGRTAARGSALTTRGWGTAAGPSASLRERRRDGRGQPAAGRRGCRRGR